MLAGIGTITTLALVDNDGQELKTKTFFLRWSPIKILSSLPFFFCNPHLFILYYY